MTDIDLTQAEADALIKMKKVRIDSIIWNYPPLGGSISIPLSSIDKRENFLLDISRGHIDLRKGKYQNRARQIIVLVRLDFNGAPHRNPDGMEVTAPHLHIYREGFGDKWAYPVPIDEFPNLTDVVMTLDDFMRFCNIVDKPDIQTGLFTC